MAHFEIEVKSLLGSSEAAMQVKERMQKFDPAYKLVSTNSQLNHYFEGGDIEELYKLTTPLFTAESLLKFEKVVKEGKDFSVRTRERDSEVLLVVKASLDDQTSANGVVRLEFEELVSISLAELDNLLQKAGYNYQAKWSRQREEYSYKDITVCFDKNAGYGYVAEFEKIIHDKSEVESARAELDGLMLELGVVELSQDRLARMFAHYNEHWAEYYGTDRTFIIE